MRLVALLLMGIASSQAAAATATPADPATAAFEARLAAVMQREGIPGGAYAIVRDGRIIAAAGLGRRSAGVEGAVTADTVFRVASVSKTFAGQLAALLVADGRLRLDERVDRYVPTLRFKRPAHGDRLQLQHLLGHSTGIVSNAYDNLLDANVALERILPQFGRLDPLCAPGRCYTYQNILFSLIEPALERAGGQPYADQLQLRLLGPLAMHRTSVGLDAFLAADNRAEPHVRAAGRWVPTKVQPGYYQVAPAAGVNASAADLGRWLLAQLGANPEVVSAESVALVTQKRVRTARDLRRRGWRDMLTDAHYGLGWRIYEVGDDEIMLHSGWVKGFVADISYSPRHRTGLAVLLNAESGVLGELGAAFWGEVLRAGTPAVGGADSSGAHAAATRSAR